MHTAIDRFPLRGMRLTPSSHLMGKDCFTESSLRLRTQRSLIESPVNFGLPTWRPDVPRRWRPASGRSPMTFPEGGDIVMEAEDRAGKPRLWQTTLERQERPRPIPNVEGRQPRAGPAGIFFRGTDGTDGFVYRVGIDGTGLRRALKHPVLTLFDVSPDGRWIVGWVRLADNGFVSNYAFPAKEDLRYV
jgi:hypothetical protein